MSKLKPISGERVVKILCNKMGFQIKRKSGSHVMLIKETNDGKIGTVVPMHKELKMGTLKSILKLGKIDEDEFLKYV